MRFQLLLCALLASAMGSSHLYKRANMDEELLQTALGLEQVKNALYSQYLSIWSERDFINANFTVEAWNHIKYVAYNTQQHILFLETTLTSAGLTPVRPCSCSFPRLTPRSFVELANTFEGVTISYYLYSVQYFTSTTYLSYFSSILVTKGADQCSLREGLRFISSSSSFGTQLSYTAVTAYFSRYISSCPPSNYSLPTSSSTPPYAPLEVRQGTPLSVNTTITFSTTITITSTFFFTFFSGIRIYSVQGYRWNGFYRCQIPPWVSGQCYVFLTNSNSTSNFTNSAIQAGPAIVQVTAPSPLLNLTAT